MVSRKSAIPLLFQVEIAHGKGSSRRDRGGYRDRDRRDRGGYGDRDRDRGYGRDRYRIIIQKTKRFSLLPFKWTVCLSGNGGCY